MQLSNAKLVARGTRMVADALSLPLDQAKALLLAHGSARKAITSYQSSR
jgi:N-acetylmuramic acid 6-phosphate etherase